MTYLARASLTLIAAMFVSSSLAKTPDCAGTNRWPTMSASVALVNAGILDRYELDRSKTTTKRLASEQIGKDLYRQIHLITFTENAGKVVEIITSNEVSSVECSMSDVEVFVISKRV